MQGASAAARLRNAYVGVEHVLLELLAAIGVTLPAAPMPSQPTWSEAWTRVTFRADELDAVLAAMHRHHPDGQHWGWNVDGDGLAWVDAEQGLDLHPIIHEVGLQGDVEQHGVAN